MRRERREAAMRSGPRVGAVARVMLAVGVAALGIAGCRDILGLQDPVCTDCDPMPSQRRPSLLSDAGMGGGSASTAPRTGAAGNVPGSAPVVNSPAPLEAGTDAGGEPPDATLTDPGCAAYCAEIGHKCTGSVQQYQGDGSLCLQFCPYFSKAELECRTRYADVAGLDDNVSECSAAGPSGQIALATDTEQCESACDSYCSLMLAICGDKYAEHFGAGDAGTDKCQAVCAGLSNVDVYSAARDPLDNSVQCRLYHLGLRLQTGIPVHCSHAAGEGMCVAPASP